MGTRDGVKLSVVSLEIFTFWGVAKVSSVSWIANFTGDKVSECKLSNGWSRSYKLIKLLLSAET